LADSPDLVVHPRVRAALTRGAPVVALESTVIAHGLPWPDNLALAERLEGVVRKAGVEPATIAVLSGKARVGLDLHELERIAKGPAIEKLSRRDLPVALAQGKDGATTVSATMVVAHAAGIRVFATGGIGGVHRGAGTDISADLPELARTPLVVVCSGAKAILDLPATLEWLETHGVPVIGYGTNEFPAFFTRSSGLPLVARSDAAPDVAAVARAAWRNGIESAVVVAVPCPEGVSLAHGMMEAAVIRAIAEADGAGIKGKELTPWLLRRMAELTGGESRAANLALLEQNAGIAAQIAKALLGQRP
jgi:pseudouridine-5'-phosphate glycosidase